MTLASTSWHVISATLVFLAGLLIMLAIARRFQCSRRRALFLYAWHTALCMVYLVYTQSNVSDARGYYLTALQGPAGFSAGSAAIEYLTWFCIHVLGLSYLGCFLFYNLFGSVGLIAFDASLRSVSADKSRLIRLTALAVVLLPSVSFWSSAIGKDAPAFLAATLSMWAALDFRKRAGLFILAIPIMLAVRPHMAGLMVMALAGSQVIQRGLPLSARIVMGVAALAAASAMVPFGLKYAGVSENASAADVMNYIEQRQQGNLDGTASVDIAGMSLPEQLATYMFRPLPNEAGSMFGLVAATENVLLLILFIAGILWALIRRRATFFGNRAYMWLYAISAWILLALTTANLGIALRQKWMFAPLLIVLVLSMAHSRKARVVYVPVQRLPV
ncbi:hypothetical protein GSY71_10565 [Pusillimonas sp. TS35]|uniref:hypothetical protein n=1 Tax=Paracandidimonas lactea TaxID=2895524 RepID=UPI001369BA1C|nr:hypothetical protein [Paracandidimonas lactea]MYN13576.1 hypothetical protein [Pusillimonas sp. TS35]